MPLALIARARCEHCAHAWSYCLLLQKNFLVSSAKYYYGDYLRYQMGRQFYHRMGALPDVMSTGVLSLHCSAYAARAAAPKRARALTISNL